MTRFVARRIVFAIVSVLAATLVLFGLSHLSTDPRNLYVPQGGGFGITEEQWEELGRKLGLDRPFIVQYGVWLGNTVRGNWGESLLQQRPVISIISAKWGATLQLALGGFTVAVLFGPAIGVLAAVKRGTALDYLARTIALFGQAIPSFWLGIMLIILFASKVHWLPAGGRPADFDIKHYILPSFTLGWPAMASLVRLTRSAMLEVLDSEYVKFARAKGVREWLVIWKHAFKNALIIPLTSAFLLLGFFITGSFVTEIVFSWPGMGYAVLYKAVFANDFPLLMGAVVFYVVLYVLLAFAADLAYAYIDPRIRYS